MASRTTGRPSLNGSAEAIGRPQKTNLCLPSIELFPNIALRSAINAYLEQRPGLVRKQLEEGDLRLAIELRDGEVGGKVRAQEERISDLEAENTELKSANSTLRERLTKAKSANSALRKRLEKAEGVIKRSQVHAPALSVCLSGGKDGGSERSGGKGRGKAKGGKGDSAQCFSGRDESYRDSRQAPAPLIRPVSLSASSGSQDASSLEERLHPLAKKYRGTGQCIRISKLPKNISTQAIKEIFETIGTVIHVRIEMQNDTAYVVFAKSRAAQTAESTLNNREFRLYRLDPMFTTLSPR